MRSSKETLLDFAALSLWLTGSAAMAVYALVQFGQDFRGYYAAARVLLERGNPYEYEQVARVLVDVTGRAGNNPFYYPLWFGWFFAPFSLLPFESARAVWMLFNLALWVFGLLRLQKLLDFPRQGWRTWLLNLLATLIFAWMTWKFEQTGILLFVILLEFLLATQKEQWNKAGIFLALALIKPNVMLLPVIVVCLWFLRNRNWRPVIAAAVILIVLMGFTTLLTPDWYQPFFQPNFGQGLTDVLDGPNHVTGERLNTTVLDWLKWFGVTGTLRSAIHGILTGGCAWLLAVRIWKSQDVIEVASVALLASFAITPYALQYDYPPLVIVMFWSLGMANQLQQKWMPVTLMCFIASVLLWERPISDGYWIVIGLSALTLWGIKGMQPVA